jgi:hypothetical protein
MDFALFKAIEYKFDHKIIDGIQNFIINPLNRKAYFPDETLEKNRKINLTQSIAMLASWLVT